MFLNRKLGGGHSHPGLDIRLKNAIEQLELDELDNNLFISALALNIWAQHFGHEIDIPQTGDTYKELFYKTNHQLSISVITLVQPIDAFLRCSM